MANILLDYFFKITTVNPTPAASTASLKQACVVVQPKGGYTGDLGTPVLCTTYAQIAAVTDNQEARQLLDAGLSRVYVMPVDDLYLAEFLAAAPALGKFFTLLISSDFDDSDVTVLAADGTVTISSFANLVDTDADEITVGSVTFVAQAGAATEGTAAFRAATSNDATAASLAAQINAHADLEDLVFAEAVGAVVTITALADNPWEGNDVPVAYSDEDTSGTSVGATLGGLVGGKLSGGAGLMIGAFKGVVGLSSNTPSFCATQAAMENRCCFYTSVTNKAKNCFYAFGKLLSNPTDWKNQQYISMPFGDGVEELGDAETEFDNKVSFVITDDQFSFRLSLFAAGGKAIVAPYILRNLEIDQQSKGLQYVSANQPGYTLTQAALLEDELQKVIDGDGQENGNPGYIGRGWLTSGTVRITLEADDFVATGRISVPTPRALWRINATITQS